MGNGFDGFGSVRRLLVSVLVASLLASVLVVSGAPAAVAYPPPPSLGHIEQIPSAGQARVTTTSLKSWFEAFFVVDVPAYSGEQVIQVEVSRVEDGAIVNLFPYWQGQTRLFSHGGGAVEVRSPPWAFQAGYTYTWRTRSWAKGDVPGPWSSTGSFDVQAVTDVPTPGYPMFPRRDVPVTGNILRADSSALEAADTNLANRNIVSYDFEVKLVDDTAVLWSSGPVPAPAAGAMAEVSLPNVLSADTEYRWRVYAIDAAGRVSNPSRWRYFNTMGPTWQAEWDFIPDRAGNYDAGFESADEASGLVASLTHSDVFWAIRDNGPGDRSKLYAVKIGSNGLMQNIDGYMTREIDVTGIDNIDWEAVTTAPGGGLLIGDIGDYWDGALQNRSDFSLIHVAEPDPVSATSVPVTAVYPFHFPGGVALNSEAMFTLGDWVYLITKDTQDLYRFPSSLSTVDNELIYVGHVGGNAPLEIITGADISDDYRRIALTLDLKRMVVFEGPAVSAPTTAAAADAIVSGLLVGNDPTWQRYYRRAGQLEAANVALPVDWFNDPMLVQTTMQVEGSAFRPGTHDVAMISEYGRHVLFTFAEEYEANSSPLAVRPETQNGTSLASSGFSGDPVNIATGNFTDIWVDLDPETRTGG